MALRGNLAKNTRRSTELGPAESVALCPIVSHLTSPSPTPRASRPIRLSHGREHADRLPFVAVTKGGGSQSRPAYASLGRLCASSAVTPKANGRVLAACDKRSRSGMHEGRRRARQDGSPIGAKAGERLWLDHELACSVLYFSRDLPRKGQSSLKSASWNPIVKVLTAPGS